MNNSSTGRNSAAEWLAAAAPEPDVCRWEWERGTGVALLPAGRMWDVLILPAPLGEETLTVLWRLVAAPGPVLTDNAGARIGFLVPPGTSGRWVGTGVRCAGRGSWITVPHPARAAGMGAHSGLRWLVPPNGSGCVTDPAVLELAMHEAAALLADAKTRPPHRGPHPGRGG